MRGMYRYSNEQVAFVCDAAIAALRVIQADPEAPELAGYLDRDLSGIGIEGVMAVRQGELRRELHERWVRNMKDAGWIHGPDRDPVRKTHPNLLPYDEMLPDQQDKDMLFLNIVSAMTIRLTRTDPGFNVTAAGDTLGVPQRTIGGHPVHVAVSLAHVGGRAGRCPA